MSSKNDMTRKEFITLTFTLIGAGAVGACSSDSNSTGTAGTSGGTAGTFGGGTAGASGHGGAAGHAGAGGTTGAAGTTGAGGTGTAACADPLPEVQAPSDHTHTVTIPSSTLNATTAQTFDTSMVLAHMHSVTLEPAQLTTLKGGGSVMVTSSSSLAHTHVFTVSCH